MQKICMVFVIVLTFIVSGCGKAESEAAKNNMLNKIMKPNVEVENYIQDAINNANLIVNAQFFQDQAGNIFFYEKYMNYAYSYYGKKLKLVHNSYYNGILAVTEDGSLYNGTTLVSDEYKIKSMVTPDVTLMITEEGRVLIYFTSNVTSPVNYGYNHINEWDPEYLGSFNIVAACNYEDSVIFIDEKGNAIKTGDTDIDWEGCEIEGWKDVALIACTQNKIERTASVAAIAADGTVYATGDYASEILSWGDLAYISMDEDLIVGLKKDGTLAFAGRKAEEFSHNSFSNVKAVKVLDGEFVAMTDTGFIVAYIESFDGDYTIVDSEGSGNMYMMDTAGNVKLSKDGVLQEAGYLSAGENIEERIIYWTLRQSAISWGTNVIDDLYGTPYVIYSTDLMDFQLIDVNHDEKSEVFLSIGYDTAFGCVYNGNVRIVLNRFNIDGYYPAAGIIVSSNSADLVEYWVFKDGNVQCLGYTVGRTDQYFWGKEFKTDNMENEDSDIEVSEDEFFKLLKGYVGDEKMHHISIDSYVENNEENRKNLIE